MKRPWYHLHLVTCLVIVPVASALPVTYLIPFNGVQAWQVYAWPVACGDVGFNVSLLVAATDLLCYTTLLAGTGAFLEYLFRNFKLQFRLATILVFTATVATTVAFFQLDSPRWDEDDYNFFDRDGVYYFPLAKHFADLIDSPDVSETLNGVLIYFSLACTFYMALLLAARLAGWCFRIVSRRFRRSPAA